MKIGFSTFVLQGGRSGLSTYIQNLLRFLQMEDTENEYRLLMARNDADLIPLNNPGFSKRISPPFVNRAVCNLAWHNSVLAGLGKQLDLVHIPSARRIPFLKRTRVVATVHDLAAYSVDRKYDRARMYFNRSIVPAMIRNADHVIAVSQFTKNDIMRHAGVPEDRISVVYSGINHDVFRPIPKDEARDRLQSQLGLEKPFFVYVSRLEHPAKNHIGLIEAFERFKLENDSAHQLVLAGADWNGSKIIRARAQESPVKDDILFLGFVPVKSLPLLYSGCDLMVYPSLFEGFGFPIIEALACGAAVICAKGSSMSELAGTLIPTFDPLDSNDLFESMEEAVARGWNAEQRARGMEYALTFDWRNTARRVMQIYRSVAGSV